MSLYRADSERRKRDMGVDGGQIDDAELLGAYKDLYDADNGGAVAAVKMRITRWYSICLDPYCVTHAAVVVIRSSLHLLELNIPL